MSNALAKIDSKVAAQNETIISDEDALATAKGAGFDDKQMENLKRAVGKQAVGDYMKSKMSGVIIADAMMDRQVLDELQDEMMKVVRQDRMALDGSVELQIGMANAKIDAAGVVTTVMSKKAELATLQLKAVEIGGFKKPERKMKSVGPPIDLT